MVAYEGLYDGIDLHAWGQRSSLKYEFHVAPGADWTQIAVRYDGIAGLSLVDDGSLTIDLGQDWGHLTDAAPYIYQTIDGQHVEVAGRFVLLDRSSYAFEVTGAYDSTQPLVIDPDLAWATYLGGSGEDWGLDIDVDAEGNALVTGYTQSSNFTGANNTHYGGTWDSFVAKVSSSGALQWATYVGGSGTDYSYGISVDAAGNALVTGYTESSNFAGANNSYKGGLWDGFVAKVSSSGVLEWAVYLGGSEADSGHRIAVDTAGNALVTGRTESTNFVEADNAYKGGSEDAYVARISSAGVLQWATYLGGSGSDIGYDIALDAADNATVTGWTASTNFTGANKTHQGGTLDAFAAKVSSYGMHQWTTYLGGSGEDRGYGIAFDPAGDALLTGWTASTDFGGANNTYKGGTQDAFVAKIAYATQSLSVTSVSAQPRNATIVANGGIELPVEQLVVTFSDSLDPATVSDGDHWELRHVGPDGILDTADDELIPLTLATPFSSGSTVTLDVDSPALSIGFYRFTVLPNAVSDTEGNPNEPFELPFRIVPPPVNEIEPNDSLASATPLPLYEDPVGSGL